MKIVVDIPEELYKHIKNDNVYYLEDGEDLYTIVKNGKPLANITDEQISDAFQIAIANYWDEKSKHLTPPPLPCNCPIQENRNKNKRGDV